MHCEPGSRSLQVTPADDIRMIRPPVRFAGWSGMEFVAVTGDDQ
jgi:hypothetical protein